MSGEGLVRRELLNILLLVGKNMRFLRIFQIIIDHAPDRRISGPGFSCNDLNRMLPVKNIIYAIAPADLDRIDLIYVKFRQSIFDMALRQHPLVVLIGYQIFDRYQLK